jgi:hypothetical protein
MSGAVESLHIKGFHLAHVAQAGDPTLCLDIFILAWMVPQYNASDLGRNLAGEGQCCSLVMVVPVDPDWHEVAHG